MKKILIVDDDNGMTETLADIFSLSGFNVITCDNGIDAMKLLSQESPSYVLLDVKMPGMNGIEVLKEMKNRQPSLPVIMMTAYAENNLLHEAMNAGAETVLSKPFNISSLMKKYLVV